MSSLLYYSISLGLTEEDTIEIDKQVKKNREEVYFFVKKLPSNSKRKVKRVFLYATCILQFSQPLVLCAATVLLFPLPSAIHIEQDRILSNKNGYPQVAIIPELKVDKIRLTNEQVNNLGLQLNTGSITMEETLLQLRGGDMSPLTEFLFRFILIWPISNSHTPTEGFKPGGLNTGFGPRGQVQPAPRIAPKLQENPLNRNNPGQGFCRAKQNNHDGTLTKEFVSAWNRTEGQIDDLLINGNIGDYP